MRTRWSIGELISDLFLGRRRPRWGRVSIGVPLYQGLAPLATDLGHRLRAMEHVSAALSQLGASFPVTAVSMSTGNRPQWESDQILCDATRTLVRTELMLASGSQRGAHHEHARHSVAAAIRELHLALGIR